MDAEQAAYPCPVCGYPQDEPPYNDDGTIGSQEICPSCGIQFGYDDARADLREQIWRDRRQQWIDGGMRWWSPQDPPDDWDPELQLLRFMSRRPDLS